MKDVAGVAALVVVVHVAVEGRVALDDEVAAGTIADADTDTGVTVVIKNLVCIL